MKEAVYLHFDVSNLRNDIWVEMDASAALVGPDESIVQLIGSPV